MGNLGVPEIIFIAVLALLIFGPKRLPEIARTVGKAVREFRAATQDLTDEIRSGIDSPKAPPPKESPPPKPGPKI